MLSLENPSFEFSDFAYMDGQNEKNPFLRI